MFNKQLNQYIYISFHIVLLFYEQSFIPKIGDLFTLVSHEDQIFI
jgi:hypothetical protein